MREQVERLAKLATDLLDLSRLDAGRMRVEHEPVDLGEVAQRARGGVPRARRAARAPARGRGRGRPVARADELRVLQVGRALLDNALVHTPAGTRVTCGPARDREHALRSRSRTTAPGVAGRARRARLRPLLPRRGRRRLRQRARARDRARAGGDDGRRRHARVPAGADGRPGRARRRADARCRADPAGAFSRENGTNGRRYSATDARRRRSPSIALVAAVLGATGVLVVGRPRLARRRRRRRARSSSRRRHRDRRGAPAAARRCVGNGFDPARSTPSRSQGVVTIYSFFAQRRSARRAPASSSPTRATC